MSTDDTERLEGLPLPPPDDPDATDPHWLPPDAEPAFDGGRLKVDIGLEAGVPGRATAIGADDDHVGGGEPPQTDTPPLITPGPAPTGEEPTTGAAPLVLELNMNKVKMRELRACERILAIVFGKVMPVLPMLEDMPADLAIALLAHKKLVSEGVDCSRLSDTGALEQANEIREAFEWAEEIDFADLASPPAAEGEGKAPADPTAASNGGALARNAIDTLTSRQPS